MGAWAYCRKCNEGLRRSTAREVINEAHICPHCGFNNPPNIDLAEALEDLEERITRLEEAHK